jgi:hypothetical protein
MVKSSHLRSLSPYNEAISQMIHAGLLRPDECERIAYEAHRDNPNATPEQLIAIARELLWKHCMSGMGCC